MKIELGKEYETRDGREVRIYAVDCGGFYAVHGAVKRVDGFGSRYWDPETWIKNGRNYTRAESDLDLIEKPKTIKGEVWVAIKRDGSPHAIVKKDGLPIVRLPNDRALIRLPFECKEGQFDE